MKRRTFLKTTACLAVPYFVPRHVFAAPGRPAASDRIRAGVIGTGGRIAYVISEAPKDIRSWPWPTATCDRWDQLPRSVD